MSNKKNNTSILSAYRGLPHEVYILFLGKMINCIGAFVRPMLSLILTQKLGLSPSQSGIFITLTGMIQAPCVLIGGKFADNLGRKKTIVIFQSISAIVYIICGIIGLSHLLPVLLVVAGCFSSVTQASYDAMVGDITTPENRKSAFSLIYVGLNLGFAIGPLIAGLLYKNFLPFVFIGDAITTLISLGLISIFIKETYDKNSKKPMAAVHSSLEAVEKGSVFKVFLKRPILIYYSLIMCTFQFAYSQWSFAVPIQLSTIFGDGLGARYFGILGSCNAIIVVLFTPILVNLTKKMRILTTISMGGIFYAFAFGSCGFHKTLLPFFFVIFFVTIGEILISTNSGTFITNLTPASHRGRVNSILPLIYEAGNAIGPTVMGLLLRYTTWKISWIVVGVVAIVGTVFMYLLNYVRATR